MSKKTTPNARIDDDKYALWAAMMASTLTNPNESRWPRKLTPKEELRMRPIAELVTMATGVVSWEEHPPRLFLDTALAWVRLRMVYLGLEILGLHVRARWRILAKVGWGMIPVERRVILNSVLVDPLQIFELPVPQVASDLEALGLVLRSEGFVFPTAWFRETYTRAFAKLK